MKKKSVLIRFLSLLTLLGGAVNLYSTLNSAPGHFHRLLRGTLPLEFLHVPHSFTLLIGLALIVSSVNIWKRKRRAFQLVLVLAGLAVFFNLLRHDGLWQALFSVGLIALMLGLRNEFTVRSRQPDWRAGAVKLALVVATAFSYGVAGFWLLDVREFGLNFNWLDAIHRTLRYLTFIGDPSLVPHTRYAAWFLDSLYALSAATATYALVALFRPILYHYRTLPQERVLAAEIIGRHGRSSLDFFKLWPDKSYFFNAARTSVIAYGVDEDFAVALGDPVGPAEEIEPALREFKQYCEANGWGLAFYQTPSDLLPVYQRAGFKRLKIGDDAIIDLEKFSLAGAARRKLRQSVNRLEAAGMQYKRFEAPLDDRLLNQLQEISDQWLSLPGRRERTFSLGLFDRHYVRHTPVVTAQDAGGRMLAFANVIPSLRPATTTFDLMRHRPDAPNGTMDFLFVKHFLAAREQGFAQFDLGMVPLSNFTEREDSSATERAVNYLLRRLDFMFSFGGLKHFKAKFADRWEPRYVIYRHVLELPRLGIALPKLSELNRYEFRMAQIRAALSSGALPHLELPPRPVAATPASVLPTSQAAD